MKKIFFTIISLALFLQVQAQQEPRPEWAGKTPPAGANFFYVSGEGEGASMQEAKSAAWTDALFNSFHAGGIISIQGFLKTNVTDEKIHTRKDLEMVIDSNILERPLACETPEIQLCNGRVKIYVLLQVQYDGGLPANFENYQGCSPEFDKEVAEWNEHVDNLREGTYPFSPRVFIPGLRQLDKGSTTKAWIIIGGEVAFLGGAGIAELLRRDANKMFFSTHDKEFYRDKARQYQGCRDGLLILAAALYGYNVIDGIAAKGAKKCDKRLAIVPYVDTKSGGISLTFNF
ncbi:MAG: hypothetical protein FWD60_00415 [Candidatus Azobacteroides sp.]|nr:hypothetical protein [Candidatus Azobacteroides sp.]